MIGLFALLTPASAQAQTNLDQGKTPAQIFATACVECHKAPQGLAHGKNGEALTEFLREHYTTSAQQAAALAAYVMGGRGAETGAAAQGRGQKPAGGRATAAVEEPKPAKRRQANPGEQPSIMAPALQSATSSRNRHKEPRTPSPALVSPAQESPITHTPAAAAAEPAPTERPSQEESPPAAAAPADAASSESSEPESAPVPRDHIPD
jgi:hypothetical protein